LHFIGFLPRRGKPRTELLARLAAEPATLILYEAPHRLARTLADLSTAWGGERQVVVARELTKLYEEFWRGSLAAASAHFGTNPVRGEITLVVAGRDREKETSRAAISVEEAVARIEKYRQNGESLREAIRRVAKETGWANNELYRHYLAKKKTSQRE
ncbi:MAG: rRNA (cytidine-2'-O-)-methyltransferase, partial [Firmicutes bacterium]|nr:rRNA (cytidine-2'-O-)-methyltransferase [Bacillota bacterium]